MIEVSEEGVELAKSRMVHSTEVGGDTEFTVITKLDAEEGFDQYRFNDWMSLFTDLESAEDAALEVERHHI